MVNSAAQKQKNTPFGRLQFTLQAARGMFVAHKCTD